MTANPKQTLGARQQKRTRPVQPRVLYPAIEPYRVSRVRVSRTHTLYVEESGNPHGKPVVFLHGGPGGGSSPGMRRFFDPRRYRIILFDQRGCGKSRPHASLVANTTWDLVSDLEVLRVRLGIERWQVFGGSWGATLALAYAETHPERVTELVLRGIFMLRRWELEWFYQDPGGAAALFPDLWEHYSGAIPKKEHGDMMKAYYRRLKSSDRKIRMAAARAWSIWEGATSYLRPNPDYIAQFNDASYAAAFARIECHYFVNSGFFKSDAQLLENAHQLHAIPGTIVQGRYDVVCPMRSAWDLHRAWPQADLRIVADAGHSAFETGTIHELVSATDRYATSRS